MVPPVGCAQLPATGGQVGPEPEDFKVDEIPRYEPAGEGQHWYVRLRKRGRTTQELIQAVARAAGVRPRDIGAAGQKDKHAVTSQWLSLLETGCIPPAEWQLEPEYEILSITRHGNKLRTGHLSGNRFCIRVVDAEPEHAAAIVDHLNRHGLRNYFGVQRFGRDGDNLARALHWLRQARINRQARFENKLYPSVVQAEIFNRYLALRDNLGSQQLVEGEVVRLAGSGSMFQVEQPDLEAERLLSGDIVLTGPMIGPKMRPAAGRALELEQEALKQLGLSEGELEKLGRWAPGVRRDLLVWPEQLCVAAAGPRAMLLEFGLPAGSYATQLIREFCAPREAV